MYNCNNPSLHEPSCQGNIPHAVPNPSYDLFTVYKRGCGSEKADLAGPASSSNQNRNKSSQHLLPITLHTNRQQTK